MPQAKARGFSQVKAHEIDVVTDAIPAKHADAAKAFVRFLQSPEAVAILKAKGLEVPAR